MHDREPFDDEPGAESTGHRRPRWRTALRWTTRLVGPLGLCAALFLGVFASANGNVASIDGAQPIDYHEECNREGCSRHEVEELWHSFQGECLDDRCFEEEVFELAGGPKLYGEIWRTKVPDLYQAFRERLGKRWGIGPELRPGRTKDVWWSIRNALDGYEFKTPKVACDPYCG